MLKEVKYLAQCYKAVKLKFKSNNLTPGLQMVENPPAAQETGFQPLGGEDPLEQEMATHCGALAWRIPWTKEPDGLQSMES